MHMYSTHKNELLVLKKNGIKYNYIYLESQAFAQYSLHSRHYMLLKMWQFCYFKLSCIGQNSAEEAI